MTSLKVRHADEIIEAMVNALADENFTGVFRKEAMQKKAGQALEAYKNGLAGAQNKDQLDALWNQYVNTVAQEEGTTDEMACFQAHRAKGLKLPGYQVPGCADDQPVDDQKAKDCECTKKEEEVNNTLDVAAEFTMQHLAKLADTLDRQGFGVLADVVDETIQKVASKKR